MKEHYSPGEIKFTRVQVLWLLQNLGSLRDGYWPPEASNYTDSLIIKSGGHKAPFVTPIDFAAEIEARLERCGLDGLILEAIECWGKSEASIASYFGTPEWKIFKRYKRALRYVASGPARRWHNTKKRQGVTYHEFENKTRRKLHTQAQKII